MPPSTQALMPSGSPVRIEAKISRESRCDPSLRDQLAHPHQQHAAGGEREDDQRAAAEVRVECALALEEEREARGLGGGEDDRQVPRVLVDLGVAGLALLLELLEPRDDHGHELEDDRGGDVRMSRARNRNCESAPGKEVERRRTVTPPDALKVVLDRVGGHTGRRDPSPAVEAENSAVKSTRCAFGERHALVSRRTALLLLGGSSGTASGSCVAASSRPRALVGAWPRRCLRAACSPSCAAASIDLMSAVAERPRTRFPARSEKKCAVTASFFLSSLGRGSSVHAGCS